MARKKNTAAEGAAENTEAKAAETTEAKAKKPRKPKAVKAVPLETILMNCRNKLRSAASMEVQRDLLLTLTFLRFIYYRFRKQQEKILAELTEEDRNNPQTVEDELNDKSAYGKHGVFFLRDEYRWDKLLEQRNEELATKFDTAITRLMENEKNLKNALPANIFTNARIDPSKLKAVIDEVHQIDPEKFGETDLIGRVYEYFMQQFAVNAGSKEEGEFYTPQSIVELLANLIEPFDGKIYDPCCGSGGMFVQSMKIIEAHGGDTRGVTVYGQESNPNTYRLAKMNLAVRGINYHLGDINISTFTKDVHEREHFDYIMANPPFNLGSWAGANVTKDPRWKGYATPPLSNANYAWILHMLYHLDKKKGVAAFLLSNGALDDADSLEIRKKLIENDKVEAILSMPREMFYKTDTGFSIWILNQNKKGGNYHGRKLRNREGEILFIDLRTWTENKSTIKTDSNSRKIFTIFTKEQIRRVAEIYHTWQTREQVNTYCEPELYYAATLSEIEGSNYSLVPSRYVEFVERRNELELKPAMKLLDSTYAELIAKAKSLKTTISETSHLSKYFTSLKEYYPLTPLGGTDNEEALIESCDEINSDNKYTLDDLRGLGIKKTFIPTKANMDGVSLTSYKVVKPNEFCYVTITSRNSDKITIALNDSDKNYIVSSSYEVFRVKDHDKLYPAYLMLLFCRPEFDRYARFNSWGSAREAFSFEEMKRVRIPLPPIDVQRSIVAIYQCAQKAKQIAEEADRLSKEVCPALIQHMIHEYDK